MKVLLISSITFLLLFSYCSYVSSKDENREFIPGTYIRFSAHEFGKEFDTLTISLQNSAANEYKIIRKWRYERVLDGSAIEPEYKRKTTTGTYDNNSNVMHETQTGNLYSFDIKQELLFVGTTKYKKL